MLDTEQSINCFFYFISQSSCINTFATSIASATHITPAADANLDISATSTAGANSVAGTTSSSGPTSTTNTQALNSFNKSDSSLSIRLASIWDSFDFFNKGS